MPSRLTVVLSTLFISMLLITGLSIRWALSEAAVATQLQTQVDGLTDEVRVLDARLRAVPAEIERQRELRKPVEKALNANPDWRDTPVPDAVADGLCSRIRCAPVHPVPTPNR